MQRRATVLRAAGSWCAVVGLCGVASAQVTVTRTMTLGGLERSWILHLPPQYDGVTRLPLVIAMHPGASNAQRFSETNGWHDLANQEGIVVVHPNATSRTGGEMRLWNSYDFEGTRANFPDDVAFLKTLIDTLLDEVAVDPTRVYMTGFSNGAQMLNHFACVHTGVLAATGPVSGGWLTSYIGTEEPCRPDAPLPVWVWRGEREEMVVPAGGLPRSVQDEDQRRFWVAHNQSDPVPAISQTVVSVGTQSFVQDDQVHAPGRAEVRFTEVRGTSHQYQPGAAQRLWFEFFDRFRRGTAPRCQPDINADGCVDGQDLAEFVQRLGELPLTGTLASDGVLVGCEFDADGDGIVTDADAFSFVELWAESVARSACP